METEELIRKCSAITLEEEEEDKVIFGGSMKAKGEKIAAGCLVGKILSTRGISYEGVKAALQQAWRPVGMIKVESLRHKIFMFKFYSEEDKRRVLMGGPWHFDRALIVLEEPKGIGNVADQPFSHVSFWVQLHNVPLMCMQINTIREMGSKIGRVEDVATDETGDCFGEYILVRISIDITKRLKKVLRIQQENGEEIVVGVVYEKLPDYCFCCSHIGHQFRECAQYKGQPKESLAYGAWLKAVPLADRMRFQKSKDKDRREYRRSESSENTETHHHQHPNPTEANGAGAGQDKDAANNNLMRLRHIEAETDNSLMPQGTQSRRDQISRENQLVAAVLGEKPENMGQMAGIMSGNKNVEGKEGNQNSQTGRETHQLASTQMSLVEEVVDNGSFLKKPKAKWRRWKNQARRAQDSRNSKAVLKNAKRANCEKIAFSPTKEVKALKPKHEHIK
ncbi:uncharacterized protein LOC127901390 [Citrus sinensis]|uniref:uncharacterized protein LOC112100347 n=1 Tax=Citrus clementina TaxID=85681 RepID=UPI000CED3B35|nr:uncharacterized protein LOC112100347 [Citrus x clementina]XP_052294526.1 uncharacterized protein LOC127901390 [Citrus sinensis]